MAERCLLHKTKLDDFLDWAVKNGAHIEQPKGAYQRARFRFPGDAPHIIYDKHSSEHYSLDDRTAKLFWRYHKEQEQW